MVLAIFLDGENLHELGWAPWLHESPDCGSVD